MAKSSRPDRKRGDRRNREPSEFEETTLSVDRVTRVVKGGRRMRFRAIVVVGNKKGKVGLGTGKAAEVQAAVQKATKAAKREMIRVPLLNGTIPHEVDLKFKSAKIRIMPARPGTGVIAGGALRVILEAAGVKNVLSKRFGTRNKLVNAQAVMLALQKLHSRPEHFQDVAPKPTVADPDAAALETERGNAGVKVVSRSQIDAEGNLRGN
ncbi:MAG: 30S ribosomal subunit protein S5 [Candidatus Peregrinibacteria bacterium Greene0416_62]|nr:MAG: 30S ribosomal subunit protein S5 [Candidatus Peregrinibacteria bacterium Greene0416_62]TSC98638.1 MAG: 30S ribosomal subunit protein S5 [Candidatus Peregrinibacteria bacterium Greene1014_49]